MIDVRRQPDRLAASPGHMPHGQGERILYVDDDDDVRHVATALIAHLGYRVRPFRSPAEAVEAFIATPDAFDAVVTDFLMPSMRGDDLVQRLRAIRADLPVLVVSGVADAIERDIIDNLWPIQLLSKPVSLGALAIALRGALAKAER